LVNQFITSLITCKLRQTYFIELGRGIIIVQNFEEISYERTVTHLHFRANDINSGPFCIYIFGKATLQTLYCKPQLAKFVTGEETFDQRGKKLHVTLSDCVESMPSNF